ncbi:hypothetical protein ACIQB5_45530 [Streptomyces sp. NPDC088560]|uniref:hypothetical protein n=1 Tax=Streptomyces sp. NPDC088560 TaxID=3365868 RepID=UPI0037F6E113
MGDSQRALAWRMQRSQHTSSVATTSLGMSITFSCPDRRRRWQQHGGRREYRSSALPLVQGTAVGPDEIGA